MNFSDTVTIIQENFPGLYSKEAIGALVANDKISYEAAARMVSNIEARSRSSESSAVNIDGSDANNMPGLENMKYKMKDIKFSAMVDACKKDDTMLYNEFVELDKARERIASQIVAKEERNFNQLLNEMKTTGADPETIDSLLGTKLDIAEWMRGK